MGMSMEDRYYEPDDSGYPDDWDWKVEQYAFDLLKDRLNYLKPENWAEGVVECGYDDSDYPTPSHAPMEVIDRVSVYWYDIAFQLATEYYEEHPYDD